MSYTVEKIHNCTVIRGPIPAGDMGKLLVGSFRSEGEQFLDGGLADRLNATLVFGSRKALDAFRTVAPVGEKTQALMDRARLFGLGERAIAWLGGYDRGSSSEALFACTTGFHGFEPTRQFDSAALPRDADDFGRCVRLASDVPEVARGLTRAMALSRSWEILICQWTKLVVLFAKNDKSLQDFLETANAFQNSPTAS